MFKKSFAVFKFHNLSTYNITTSRFEAILVMDGFESVEIAEQYISQSIPNNQTTYTIVPLYIKTKG